VTTQILPLALEPFTFGAIIRGVTRLLDERPEPKHWLDITIAL
jgi:hypothetical protein